ncbi:MAG: hypothetical protein ACOC0J_02140 [Myxococcota bacterium]
MAIMTDREMQVCSLKCTRALLEKRLEDEQETIRQIEQVCIKAGYDQNAGCLIEWLTDELLG